MIAGYHEQLGLLTKLTTISESIRDLVKMDNIDHAGELIEKRDKIILEINLLDKKSKAHQPDIKYSGKVLSFKQASEMKALSIRLLGLKQRIIILDDEVKKTINEKMNDISDELKKTSSGARIIQKYSPFSENNPKWFSCAI